MADDREIFERICLGDSGIFDGFYHENAPRLRNFLRQLVGNAQTAEDLMQETFLQLWSKPNRFHPGNGTLRSYLFGIARHRAAEWWRQSRAYVGRSNEASNVSLAEISSLVGDALSRLNEEQRTLLWLREVEGFSYEELARTLEIPIGTVRSRLFTAREAMRKVWHSSVRVRKEEA